MHCFSCFNTGFLSLGKRRACFIRLKCRNKFIVSFRLAQKCFWHFVSARTISSLVFFLNLLHDGTHLRSTPCVLRSGMAAAVSACVVRSSPLALRFSALRLFGSVWFLVCCFFCLPLPASSSLAVCLCLLALFALLVCVCFFALPLPVWSPSSLLFLGSGLCLFFRLGVASLSRVRQDLASETL